MQEKRKHKDDEKIKKSCFALYWNWADDSKIICFKFEI
jgi:hypothetical protein